MPEYLAVPIDTDPEDLIAMAVSSLQSRFPGWQPHDAELDTAILESYAVVAAMVRDIASQVPDTIYRHLGATIHGIQPIDATSSTVNSTWIAIDNLGHTIPAGTQVSIRDAGGNQIPFAVVADVVIAVGATTTTAGAVQLQSVEPGADTAGLGGAGVLAGLLDVLEWVSSVTLTGVTLGGVDDELDSEYLDRLRTRMQLLSPRPILAKDFAVLAQDVAGVYRAVAVDGYNPLHNLLTLNEASAETDASGWAAAVNVTVGSTAAQAADGTKSVSMTSIAAGDMAIRTPAGAGTLAKPVNPGETVTGLVYVRAAATPRQTQAQLEWLTAAGATISLSLGTAANDSTSAWTAYSVTGVAPPTAAFVRIRSYVAATVLGEVHYTDKASIRRGVGTDWVPGDTVENNNERMVTVFAVDQNGAAVSAPVKTAIDDYLESLRELNFLVFEADPTYLTIDVTYQVKALPGFLSSDVVSRVNTAIANYLYAGRWGNVSPTDEKSWVNQTVIRYLEIAAVINAVTGVDYITTTAGNYDLTMRPTGGTYARADIQMGGAVSLPVSGIMTGTAVAA